MTGATTSAEAKLAASDGDLRDLHRTMLRIRRFEERVSELQAAGSIAGSVHLAIGQEAIPVGVMGAATPDDRVFATYRGHGWAIACGVPLVDLFAEFMGRETGINGGRGGSPYFSAPDYGFMGENSIVGAGAPLAVGAALAMRFDGSRASATICSIGDGALNQGSVHEAFNFAATFSLPVVFVCENNLWSELTPVAAMVRSDELYRRSAAYPFPGVRVDGNDPLAVKAAAGEALERARGDEGPTLIEAMTYRLVGHYSGDFTNHRPKDEVERARSEEPLVRSAERLTADGLTTADLDAIERDVIQEVQEALAEATAAPLASTTEARSHVLG